jgi:hypothetical protein
VPALFHHDDRLGCLDQREVHDGSTRWNKRHPGGGDNQRKSVQLPRGCVIVVVIVERLFATRIGMSMKLEKVSVDDRRMIVIAPRTRVNVLEWSHGKRLQQRKACLRGCDGSHACF